MDKDGGIDGFHLYYDIYRDQRALFWTKNSGFSHHEVDTGENRPGKPKGTPMIMDGGRFDKAAVVNEFKNRSHGLPPDVASFILSRIDAYDVKA